MLELIGNKGLDVPLLREPYIQKQAESNIYSIKGSGVAMGIAAVRSKYPWAAVAASKSLLQMTFISQLNNSHCVCAELRAPGFSFCVVSHNFQWSDDIEKHLRHLETVLPSLRGKRGLVAGDSNARSPLWGLKDRRANSRGRKLEIDVVNRVDEGPTYSTTQGASYIDVILASQSIARLISDKQWRVRDSDHNATNIRLRVPKDGVREHQKNAPRPESSQRFDTKSADWDRFVGTLKCLSACRLEKLALTNKEEVEIMASTVISVLLEACTESMLRKRRYRASNPWWTKELTQFKKKTYERRRTYQEEVKSQERRK